MQATMNFIAGKWVGEKKNGTIKSINPANTEDVVAEFPIATIADTKKAIESAKEAFKTWRKIPSPARARYIEKAVRIARSQAEDLAKVMTREEGKILSEAKGEIEKGINLLEWYSGEGLRFMGMTAPSEIPNNLLYTLRYPLGVVSIITPWNFPWAIPCWKIAPALVAGNTIVFKPASLTPLMAVRLLRIFEEAGLPEGVLNMLVGSGSTVGDEMVKNAGIRAVSFTGSNSVGGRLYEDSARRGIKVTCEMGGKNPCVIMEDADLDLALGGVVKGAFGSTGQRCTATSRLIVMEAVADQFVKMIVEAAKKIKVGDGMDPSVGMGPCVDKHQYDSVLEYMEIGKKEGKLLIGGGKATGAGLEKGYFVQPTVFDRVKPTMRIFQEEIFGPVLSIVRVKSFEEALAFSNDVRYGLTSAIYTRDINCAMRYIDEVEAGMVHVNSPTIGGEAQVPFGGVKATGVGEREMAKEGINFFTEQKTVFLDYTGAVRKSNIY